ncbi:MAG: ArsC/Spx/MgsR family protein [Sedimentisphaeraceae bacterium JB056]
MKAIIFYEKPGCKGNARQKASLEQNGFTLEVRSILDQNWTKETLRPFFDDRPVKHWFNMTAPVIKEGLVKPGEMDEEQALDAMLKEHLLIRRPLIEYHGKKSCGFDDYVINDVLELKKAEDDLEVCQMMKTAQQCD